MCTLVPTRLAAALAVACILSLSFAPAAFAQASTPNSEPGKGVICTWALLIAISEIGRRCHPGQDIEVQEEWARLIARLDAYVIANSDPPLTNEIVTRFKRQQGLADTPNEKLCTKANSEIYRSLVVEDTGGLREWIDASLARPGKPTWGDCL